MQVYAGSAEALVEFAKGGGAGTIFMFGQTGSGKTYTMAGIYARMATTLFGGGGEGGPAGAVAEAGVSFVELAGEQGHDLLCPEEGSGGGAAAAAEEQQAELEQRVRAELAALRVSSVSALRGAARASLVRSQSDR